MSFLSDKEFEDISQIFTCCGFVKSAVDCNPSAKELYEMLKRVGQSEVGARLLRGIHERYLLDVQVQRSSAKIHMDYNYNNNKVWGYYKSYPDEDGSIIKQEVCLSTKLHENETFDYMLIHELTHALQRRITGDGISLQDHKLKFNYDRLCEAEARLNSVEFLHEKFKNFRENGDHEKIDSFSKKIKQEDVQTYNDYLLYTGFIYNHSNYKKSEINQYMMEHFYNDDKWKVDYIEQNIAVADQKREITKISDPRRFLHNIHTPHEVIDTFSSRLKLSSDTIRKYFITEDTKYRRIMNTRHQTNGR